MKYTLLLLVLLSPLFSSSQESEKSFQLGFTLSPTLSWLTDDGDKIVSAGPKAGLSYGVVADFGFAKNYFFSTAFTLTSLNSKTYNESSPVGYRFKLQYIEVPFTLKLKSNPSKLGKFYGQFGLGTGINVSAKRDILDEDMFIEDESFSSDLNTFRLGLIAGGGAEWNIGRNLSAVTGVSFNNGFTKTFKGYDSKNPFVTLHLGVFF